MYLGNVTDDVVMQDVAQTASDKENNTTSSTTVEQRKAFIPTIHKLEKDEELQMDKTAYKMYHQFTAEYSCLSFAMLRDNLGDGRDTSSNPVTCYLVSGTCSDVGNDNKVTLMKLSNVYGFKHHENRDDSDDDSESDEDEDDLDCKPELETASMSHHGIVNRIRVQQYHDKYLTATWSDQAVVYFYDLTRPLAAVNDSLVGAEYTRTGEDPAPVYTFKGHRDEGYAMDWCPLKPGCLITGDCGGKINVWNPLEGGTWKIDGKGYMTHKNSVEDLQWSPTEQSVFISCSVDRTIRVWDVRAKDKKCQLTVKDAHTSDVNVISWNFLDAKYLLSGGDDGELKIWDLRQFSSSNNTAVACFKYHTGPIASVEWHPTESTCFAATSEDNQLTLWDISCERDNTLSADVTMTQPDGDVEIPAELMFVHLGQIDMKEVHWHAQIPGLVISTAVDGFNIFRTCNF